MSSNESSFQDRLPPHNLDAERSVLGACLIDDEVAPTVVSILKPEYFYKVKNIHRPHHIKDLHPNIKDLHFY